jgi:hypothetical protein
MRSGDFNGFQQLPIAMDRVFEPLFLKPSTTQTRCFGSLRAAAAGVDEVTKPDLPPQVFISTLLALLT